MGASQQPIEQQAPAHGVGARRQMSRGMTCGLGCATIFGFSLLTFGVMMIWFYNPACPLWFC
jgi:hypothetical protein